MVTVHAGHGWLIHQFLSPLTNFRQDHWGGTPEKRLNFLLLCIDEIRAAVGKNFPIEVRISGSERTEGGYGLDYGIQIAKALDGKVELIHVSAGTQQVEYSCVKMHPGPFEHDMENRNLAAEIKKHVKTPVVLRGRLQLPGADGGRHRQRRRGLYRHRPGPGSRSLSAQENHRGAGG